MSALALLVLLAGMCGCWWKLERDLKRYGNGMPPPGRLNSLNYEELWAECTKLLRKT